MLLFVWTIAILHIEFYKQQTYSPTETKKEALKHIK